MRDRDRQRHRRLGTDAGGTLRRGRLRVSTEGAFPLSYTFDSIGPLARTVAGCAKADAVMAGEELSDVHLAPSAPAGLRFGIAQGLPLEGLDDTVAAAFAAAIGRLDSVGARLTHETLPLLDDMIAVDAKGGIIAPEACSIHRDRIARRGAEIDANVRARIERGCAVSAADYVAMMRDRAALVRAMDVALASVDALVMPTTPIVAPKIAEVMDSKLFVARNNALRRNTVIVNFFDLCAISLPLPAQLPVGLMLIARNGHDRALLRIAAAVEKAVSGEP